MYGKIFASMYEGTLYGHWQAIVTFQQMIVLCDIDGVVDMTPQALAARTSIPLEIIEEGLKILEEPDKWSRTPGEEGKRIARLDEHRPWGWKIVNHAHYRTLVDAETVRDQNRERQKRHREKLSQDVTACHAPSRDVTPVTESNAPSRHAEAEAEAEADKRARRRRATRVPGDFSPDLSLALAKLPDVDAEREAQKFRDWEFKTPRSDWEAAWRNWVERCSETGKYAKKSNGTWR